MSFQRIVLDASSDRDAAKVESVAQQIRAGGCVALPTETVYGFATLREHEAKLRAIKRRAEEVQFTRHLADSHDVGSLPWRARVLAEAFWPGPLTLIVDGPEGSTIGFRLPDHDFTRAVIRACGGELSMTSVNRSGEPPLNTAAAIAAAFEDELDTLVVDDPTDQATPSTIVRVFDEDLEIVRQGGIPEPSIRAAAAESLLFVCTGNTCRSPLAAAIAQDRIAKRLQVGPSDLLGSGICIESAGVAAGYPSPASDGSIEVAQEVGLDLTAHQSRPVTPESVERARYVFCMSHSHAAALLRSAPEFAERIHLLDPSGDDISDPFGGDLAIYRQAREAITRAVEQRVAEVFPAPESG